MTIYNCRTFDENGQDIELIQLFSFPGELDLSSLAFSAMEVIGEPDCSLMETIRDEREPYTYDHCLELSSGKYRHITTVIEIED